MGDIYIDCDALPDWLVNKFFPNEEFVSIEDLIDKIEELDSKEE